MAGLDTDVVPDCCADSSETDLEQSLSSLGLGTQNLAPMQPQQDWSPQSFGVVTRTKSNHKPTRTTSCNQALARDSSSVYRPQSFVANSDIRDDMIEDGSHVVFDWDNTLKLYNRQTQQLSCRVSKDFLLRLKNQRGCQLYIISAIRPSQLNLATLLSEVDKLGLTDLFVRDSSDEVDGAAADQAVVKNGEYAHMGNIIICGYDKAETFLKLSNFDSGRGDKVTFFDDEEVNVSNFSILVPNSRCIHILT
ncbi:uncharacterized protein LOC143301004 [Babylonia areolata]|uniref:uncharacterized protein LOC143301004 n=1 Tax=Babylonia areolata TaxID=304850 RepID=UPI003FCFB44D